MPANEVKVSITGPTTVTFNDYTSGTPAYVLRNTPRLLSAVSLRRTSSPRQAEHGVFDSLSFYGERILAFDGEIIGSSQADRFTKEQALRSCLSLRGLQAHDGDDGYRLVQLTDEDGTLKQLYAKVLEPPMTDVIDNSDPSRRAFAFVMVAKDPRIYGQTLHSETGEETFQGTSFQVVEGESPKIPFQLYEITLPTATCENAGTFDTPPVITITGPTTSPKVTNVTTGKYIQLTGLPLADGESVIIDVAAGTIELDDGTDASAYFAAGSSWFVLVPGENEITLLDATPSVVEAGLEVEWRDSWL